MDLKMKNKIVFFLCTLLIVGSFCKNLRIIGGQISYIQDFAHIVSIRLFSTNGFICAGSIITNIHILTAAHCVINLRNDFSDVRIFTGSTTLSGVRRSSFFVQRIDIHPRFGGDVIGKKRSHNDIAIITVKKPIPFNSVQNKIELPTENIVEGSDAVVCGWGLTKFPFGDLSDHLRKVTVKVLKNSECKQIFPFPLLKDQICTYRKGRGVGPGDSGGPVTNNGKIIGVVSYSVPWIDDLPEIQSNVFKNLNFILSIIQQERITV